jgi:hypothetical protein
LGLMALCIQNDGYATCGSGFSYTISASNTLA